MFMIKPTQSAQMPVLAPDPEEEEQTTQPASRRNNWSYSFTNQVNFYSDSSDLDDETDDEPTNETDKQSDGNLDKNVGTDTLDVAVPPCKRRKLDVPYQVQRKKKHEDIIAE